MITKLSRIDSSSSSLKYSTRTCVSLCKKMMISAALEFRFDSARTFQDKRRCISETETKVETFLTIQVRMSNVHVVDALARETGRDLLALLFDFEDKREKTFDVRRWDIVLV